MQNVAMEAPWNHEDDTELHHAARLGDTERVEELLSSLVSRDRLLNALGLYRWTALQEACANGEDGIVEVLLKSGADVRTRDGLHSRTALHYAAEAGQDDIVSRLLAKCGLNDKDKRSWITAEDDCEKSALNIASLTCHHIIEMELHKIPVAPAIYDVARTRERPESEDNGTHRLQHVADIVRDDPGETTGDDLVDDVSAGVMATSPIGVASLPGFASPVRSAPSAFAATTSVNSCDDGGRANPPVTGDGALPVNETVSNEDGNVPCGATQLCIAFEYNAKVNRLKVRVKQLSGLPRLAGDLAANSYLYIKSTLLPEADTAVDSKRKSDEVLVEAFASANVQDSDADNPCFPNITFNEPLHYENIGDVTDVRRSIRLALCCRHGQWLTSSEELAFMSLPLYQAVGYLMPKLYTLQLREVMQRKSLLADNRRVQAGRVYGIGAGMPMTLNTNLSVRNKLDNSASSALSTHSTSTCEDYIIADGDNDSLFSSGSMASAMWTTTSRLFNRISSTSSNDASNHAKENQSKPLKSSQIQEPTTNENILAGTPGATTHVARQEEAGVITHSTVTSLEDLEAVRPNRSLFQRVVSSEAPPPSGTSRTSPALSPRDAHGSSSDHFGADDKVTRSNESEHASSAPLHLFQTSASMTRSNSRNMPQASIGPGDRSALFPAGNKAPQVNLFQAASNAPLKSGTYTASRDSGPARPPPAHLFTVSNQQKSLSNATSKPVSRPDISNVGNSARVPPSTLKPTASNVPRTHLFQVPVQASAGTAGQENSAALASCSEFSVYGHSPVLPSTFLSQHLGMLQSEPGGGVARCHQPAHASGYTCTGYSDEYNHYSRELSSIACARDACSDDFVPDTAKPTQDGQSPMHKAYAISADIWSGGSQAGRSEGVAPGLFGAGTGRSASFRQPLGVYHVDDTLTTLDPFSMPSPNTGPMVEDTAQPHGPPVMPTLTAPFPGSAQTKGRPASTFPVPDIGATFPGSLTCSKVSTLGTDILGVQPSTAKNNSRKL